MTLAFILDRGAYSDSFWAIMAWVLLKKIFTALTKHLLDGSHNAITNIVIYTIDLILFAWKRPFRDNMVNFSQGLAAASNFMAVLIAAFPVLLPEHLVPAWFRGPVVMWLSTASASVLALAAILDPVVKALGGMYWVGSSVGSMLTQIRIGSFVAVLYGVVWARLQVMFLGRSKAWAKTKTQKARKTAQQTGHASAGGHRDVEYDEWLQLVENIQYTSNVYIQGVYYRQYTEKYMVLKGGTLTWFSITDMAIDELDQLDLSQSKPIGSWTLHGNSMKTVTAHADSEFARYFGKRKGFELKNAQGRRRRIFLADEAVRDAWLESIDLVLDHQVSPSSNVYPPLTSNLDTAEDLELPVPVASIWDTGSFLDRSHGEHGAVSKVLNGQGRIKALSETFRLSASLVFSNAPSPPVLSAALPVMLPGASPLVSSATPHLCSAVQDTARSHHYFQPITSLAAFDEPPYPSARAPGRLVPRPARSE